MSNKYDTVSWVYLDTSPKSEPALELHSRAVQSVVAHHRVSGPNTGRNSAGRQTIKKMVKPLDGFLQYLLLRLHTFKHTRKYYFQGAPQKLKLLATFFINLAI